MLSKLFLNNLKTPISYIKFSGGEIQVSLSEEEQEMIKDRFSSKITVTAHLKCTEGIMLLLQLKNILEKNFYGHVNLNLPYVPYARYDRAMTELDSFSLKVFADIINKANFSRIVVQDCHSEITTNLLDNCFNTPQHNLITMFDNISDFDLIVAPDKGSVVKATLVGNILDKEVVYCNKTRDLLTGKLSIDFEVLSRTSVIKNKRLLIVDDICDGGGTFIGLGKELLKYEPKDISLYVTHGIFSKGLDIFENIIDNVYAYNSWIDCPKVTYCHKF